MNWDRYRVFVWDELLRLWCEDCYTEGEELGVWSDSDPTSLLKIIALATVHENRDHAAGSFTEGGS